MGGTLRYRRHTHAISLKKKKMLSSKAIKRVSILEGCHDQKVVVPNYLQVKSIPLYDTRTPLFYLGKKSTKTFTPNINLQQREWDSVF